MSILHRYISTTILLSILTVFAVFLSLELFVSFVTELSDIGKGDYGLWLSFLHVLSAAPNQLYEIFPIIGLLGSLVGLGILSSHHELTVMRAAGMSLAMIAVIVLRVALVVLLLVTFMGEVIAPALQYRADKIKEVALTSGRALVMGDTVWLRSANSFIQIGKVVSLHQLRNVTEWVINDRNQLQQQRSAQRVDYQAGQWIMSDVAVSDFDGDTRVHSYHVDSQVWTLALNPELFMLGLNEPQAMNLARLWDYIQYRQNSGLQVSNYQLSFWRRLYQPLATVVMILLALPFVCWGSTRSVTMGLKITVGVIIGLSFFIANELIGQLSLVLRIPAPIAALLPTLLFGLCGVLLVRRAR